MPHRVGLEVNDLDLPDGRRLRSWTPVCSCGWADYPLPLKRTAVEMQQVHLDSVA